MFICYRKQVIVMRSSSEMHKVTSHSVCYLSGRDKKGTEQVWLTDTPSTSANTGNLLLQIKHWNTRTKQLREVVQQNESIA